MKERKCEVCGSMFLKYTGKTCSSQCFSEIMRKHSTGVKKTPETLEKLKNALPRSAKHHAWKGGKTVNDRGYVLVKEQDSKKYVREHRVIVERALGRKLSSSEHIHHIDGDKKNNKLNNLMVVSREQHMAIHKKPVNQKTTAKNGTWFIVECNNCKKIFEVPGFQFRAGHGKYCSRKCIVEFAK